MMFAADENSTDAEPEKVYKATGVVSEDGAEDDNMVSAILPNSQPAAIDPQVLRLRASSGSASRAPAPAPRGRALLARRCIAVGGAERSESQAHQVGRKLAPDAINPGTAVEGWRAGVGDRVAGGRERRSRIPVRSGPAAQAVSWLCNKRQTQG